MNESHLPYFRSSSGLERANPVVKVEMGKWVNHSG